MRGIEDLIRALEAGPLTVGELTALVREYKRVIGHGEQAGPEA